MAVTLREFVTKWGFEVDDKELKKLDAKFAETRAGMEKLSAKMSEVGKSLSLKVTAPFLGLSAIAVKSAADAADIQEKFEKVFETVGPGAVDAAKKFGQSFGLSTAAAQELLSTNGQLIKSMGFSEQQSLNMAEQVGALSADLAEFNMLEGGAAEASDIVKSALLGQTKGLKQLGIALSKEDIEKQAVINKNNGLTFSTEKQAEAYAALQLIQKKSVDANGAYAKSQGDLGVQLQRIKASLGNMAVSFGKILLPVVQKLLVYVEKAVNWFEGLNERTKTVIVVVGALAAAVGPLLILFGSLINAVMAIRTAMVLFGNASLLAGLKFIAIPLLIAAAVVAIGLVIEDLLGFFQGKDSLIGLILQSIDEMVDKFMESFPLLGSIVRSFIVGILTPIRVVIGTVRALSGALGALMGGDYKLAFQALKEGAMSVVDPMLSQGQGKGFSSAEALGIGGIGKPVRGGANSGNSQVANVNAPITVNVPAGTPPEAVGPFVQGGISDGMSRLLRETQRNTKTAVAN